MIVRRAKDINPNATEVSLQISFGTPDVKQYMEWFCYGAGGSLHWGSIGWVAVDVAKKDAVFREAIIREWAETSCYVFGLFEDKWRKQLSAWFLRQAIKMGYFVQCEADPTAFYFGDAGMKLMKRRVEDWDKELEEENP